MSTKSIASGGGGQKPDNTKTRGEKLICYCAPTIYREVERIAKEEHRSVSNVVLVLIMQALAARKAGNK
jgi:hypothetical protein